MNVWTCKIGDADGVPGGADFPMRQAVKRAYKEITGKDAEFLFSGWGGALDADEREVVDRQRANLAETTA